jgi:hypothetical protein
VTVRRGRLLAALITTAIVACAALVAGYAFLARPRLPDALATVPTGTATVTRGTATQRVQIAGTLGYDGSYLVVNRTADGVVTAVAAPGTVVDRGAALYAVANEPVRLLLGAVPAYRDFVAGMSDGPDVAQLEQNLTALGLDPNHNITIDSHFTAATAAAIRRWQAAWGWPASRRTGQLSQGAIVFQPTALRIAQVQAPVGTAISADTPVLTATSTSRVVTAQLSADRQTQVRQGDQVLVAIAGTAPVPGTIVRIGRVAAAPDTDNSTSAGSQGANSTGGNRAPTVSVTISLILPPAIADLDSAPAQVAISTATRHDVLLVPVTALLARPGGGYQVRQVAGGFVEVRPGVFDEATGLVEVSGDGLAEGQRIEVPAA